MNNGRNLATATLLGAASNEEQKVAQLLVCGGLSSAFRSADSSPEEFKAVKTKLREVGEMLVGTRMDHLLWILLSLIDGVLYSLLQDMKQMAPEWAPTKVIDFSRWRNCKGSGTEEEGE